MVGYISGRDVADEKQLLILLEDFLSRQGWAIHRSLEDGLERELIVSYGNNYFSLRTLAREYSDIKISGTDAPGIRVYGATGYDENSSFSQQPGGASSDKAVFIKYPQEPIPYYFFCSPKDGTVYVEIEESLGVFARFGFGELDLIDQSLGNSGQFIYGMISTNTQGNIKNYFISPREYFDSQLNVFQVVPFDKGTGTEVRIENTWLGNETSISFQENASTNYGAGIYGKLMWNRPDIKPEILYKEPIFVRIILDNGSLSPLGYVPGVRILYNETYSPKDIIRLGEENFILFPYVELGSIVSEYLMIAYRISDFERKY